MLRAALGATVPTSLISSMLVDNAPALQMKLAQVGVSPEFVVSFLEKGGTVALIGLLFWLLRDEKRKNEKYEDERVATVRTMTEALSKATTALQANTDVTTKLASQGERMVEVQREILTQVHVRSS